MSATGSQPETFPVKPGDWVVSRYQDDKVATVRSVYRLVGETLVDLVIYDRDGRALGRVSPAMGGPRKFEPACDYKDWQRTGEPKFPIGLVWVTGEDGRRTARYSTKAEVLPDREWSLPQRRRRAPPLAPGRLNMDPEIEASKLRFAAQELRDAARQHKIPQLLERAEAMEEEAEQLAPRQLKAAGL